MYYFLSSLSVFRHYYPLQKNNPCQIAVPVLYYFSNLCWCGAMAAQLICNQWVAGSTPVTSSKKSYDIPLKSGACRGAFAFMSPTASPPFRKIIPPGGARVLKPAHHDAAVVFGGIIKSKRPRKKSRGRFCIIGRLSFVQPLSLLRRQGRVAAPSVCCAAACILLAAAPTATPCFRRWRRSSLLLLTRGGFGIP